MASTNNEIFLSFISYRSHLSCVASHFFTVSHRQQMYKPYLHLLGLSYNIYLYLPTSPQKQDVTLAQFFKQSLTGLNSKFSFSKNGCHTKFEEPNLPNYLPLSGGKIVGFIPFPKVLLL